MPRLAGTCSYPGCRRATYDPLCYQHRDAPRAGRTSPLSDRPTAPSLGEAPRARTRAECWSEIVRVFPDTNDIVSTESVREQTEQTIRSAVSLEAYRRFAELDIADPQLRAKASAGVVSDIMSSLQPVQYVLGPDDAEMLSHSSLDRYGRGIEESAELASFGLYKEWELGNLSGQEVDPDGIPYKVPYPQFIELTAGRIGPIVTDQYSIELSRFSTIIRELKGRPPLCPDPLPGAREMDQPRLEDIEAWEEYVSRARDRARYDEEQARIQAELKRKEDLARLQLEAEQAQQEYKEARRQAVKGFFNMVEQGLSRAAERAEARQKEREAREDRALAYRHAADTRRLADEMHKFNKRRR